MNEIEHSLSRLALAKAIKTPENPREDSWNKSLIFNQPFVRELHKQKQELYNRQRNKSQQEVQQTNTRYQYRQHRVSSSSSGSSKSIPKEKRLSVPKQKRISQRACLPSETEEETYDEEEEEEEDEDRTDDENSIRVKKSLLSLPLNKSKAESIGSAKDEGISSPSRGSTSSHSAPVTEEEDGWLPPKQPTANEEYYYQTHPMQRPISATPTEEYYYPMQPKHQPVSATPTEECYYQAQPMHRPMTIPPASMMDPLYYQRLHLQQLQLQYQQQLYLMSQTPMFYAPAPLHPIMAAEPQSYHQPITMQQPMPPQPPPHQMSTTISKKHHSRRLTSTDLRRRAEMMRTSSETSLNRHSGEIAKSSRRQSYF